MTISNDGETIVASVYNGVQYSSDGGQSFAYAEGIGEAETLSISDDGTTVLGVAYDGLVYISTDSGQTWGPLELPAQ